MICIEERMNGMDIPNPKIESITSRYYAQLCPNCNGRATVGYDRRPCPTCGSTDHLGIIYVPTGMDERTEYENNR